MNQQELRDLEIATIGFALTEVEAPQPPEIHEVCGHAHYGNCPEFEGPCGSYICCIN